MADEALITRFAKLNDTNWVSWRIMMKAELIRKKLWSVVDVAVPLVDEKGEDRPLADISKELKEKLAKRDPDLMADACSEMILRVEPSQLPHMISDDPREIWRTLESVHQARGFATSLALKRKFLTSKMRPEQTMSSWIGQVKQQAFELKNVGVDVPDQETILALTMGLPASYNTVVTIFDSTPSMQLTLDSVIARLINEETRQLSQPSENGDEALTITPKPKPKRQVDVTQVTCYFCDKKGHFKSNCPARLEWEKQKEKKEKAGFTGLVTDEDSDSDWCA